MRILLLAAASSVHTIRWANAFAEKGEEVHLASVHGPATGIDPRVTLHRLPYRHGLGYLLNGPRIARLVRDLAPDVINAHYATGYGTLARWHGRVPLVLNVWGSDVYEFPDQSPLHKRVLLRNLFEADAIVSTSHVMAERTRSLTTRPLDITVVPFGVDLDRFSPSAEPDRPGPVTIGTVKTLDHKYGVDTLVEAFIRVQAMPGLKDLRLRIVGGGSQRAMLEERIARAGLSAQVAFTGPVPHERVPDELRALDVFVALSRLDSESFGVAVIEAGACGLPVVVTNAGGLPEVVQDGVTGAVVPVDDITAAAHQIERLARSADLRRMWGDAGRALVCERYAWPACVDRMLEVLRTAAGRTQQA